MRLGKSKRRNNSNLLITVVVLAVIAIIVIAARFFLPEAAEVLYLRAEKNEFEKIVQWAEQSYKTFVEKQAPYLEEAHRRRIEITAEIEPGGKAFGLADTGSVSGLIEKSKLVVDMRSQPIKNNSLTKVFLLLEKVPFIDAELFTDRQKLYFTVPVLLPGEYFTVEQGQMEEVYDKFSIPIQPKGLVTGSRIADSLEYDATAFKTSAGKLGTAAAKYFTKDTVKYGQEREMSVSGETIRGKEIFVSLEEESATALLHELAVLIVQEDALLRYTYGNFAELSVLLGDAGLFRLFEYMDETGAASMNETERNILEKLKVEKDPKVFRKALGENLSGYRVKDGLQMTVVIDQDGNILDRKLVLDLQETKGNGGFTLDVTSGCSNTVFEDARNRFTDIIATGALGITELHIRPEFEKTGANETSGSMVVEYAVTPQDGERTGIRLETEFSSELDRLTLKTNRIMEFQAKVFGDTGEGILECEWSNTAWKNKKLNSGNSTAGISFMADMPFLGIHSFSGVLNLVEEDRFGIEPFDLPDVQQSNVTDLNSATQKDLDMIEMRIMASFGAFYLNNKPIFDVLFGQ